MGVKYKSDDTITPKVSSLFCDKLSMTLPCEPEEHQGILDKFYSYSQYKTRAGGYYNSLRLPVNTEDFGSPFADSTNKTNLLIQCAPRNEEYNFFRAECNPSHANMKDVAYWMDEILPLGYMSLMHGGVVNRFDMSVDIQHVNIDDLMIYYSNISRSGMYLKAGVVETLYLGALTSKKTICFYDKVAEVKASNSKKWPILKQEVPTVPTTRIEIRLKKHGIHLEDFLHIKNPFKPLKIGAYKGFENNYEWALFLDSVRYRGLQQALFRLPEAKRKKFHKQFTESALVGWWSPNKVWSGIHGMLSSIINPYKGDGHATAA